MPCFGGLGRCVIEQSLTHGGDAFGSEFTGQREIGRAAWVDKALQYVDTQQRATGLIGELLGLPAQLRPGRRNDRWFEFGQLFQSLLELDQAVPSGRRHGIDGYPAQAVPEPVDVHGLAIGGGQIVHGQGDHGG